MRLLALRFLTCILLMAPGAMVPSVAAGHGGELHTHWDAIPDFAETPTIVSRASGDWDNPATWSPQRLPSAADVVRISHRVQYRSTGQRVRVIGVAAGGELFFNQTVNTSITLATLLVYTGGALTIGTVSQPIRADRTAEIVFSDTALDTAADPRQYGNGLIVLGKIQMHGAIKTPTFVRLAQEPAGNTLQTSLPVSGWRSGDRLILPRSAQWAIETRPEDLHWEELTLAAAATSTLTLAAPLQHAHPGARDADGVPVIHSRLGKLLPHVGNLSRNVILRSENYLGTRGHVLLTYRAEIDIRYVLLKDLGRTLITPLDNTTFDAQGNVTHIGTNQIGRYSLHLHHVMGPTTTPANGYQYTLIGNAVDGGTKWGITLHDTHFGLIRDNVIYNALGAGIMTEEGGEYENLIERNFMVACRGTGDERGDGRANAGDYGYDGSGIWLSGPFNRVRDNVVANQNGWAYNLFMLGGARVPLFKGADTSKPSEYRETAANREALVEFRGNEGYSNKNAVTIWNLSASCCTGVHEGRWSVIKDLTLWHTSRYGLYGYGSNRTAFDGWVQYGDREVLTNRHEFSTNWFGDYISRNVVFKNCQIEGHVTGITVPIKPGDMSDIYGGAYGETIIENCTLRNVFNIGVRTMWGVTGGGAGLPPRRVTIRNTRFGSIPMQVGHGAQYSILMSYSLGTNPNVIQRDEVYVESYNGEPGKNFRIFYPEQHPTNFIVPQSTQGLVASPEAGLNNTQNWQRYGIAVGGAISRCTDNALAWQVYGYVCPITADELRSLPIAPDFTDGPPSAPRFLRLRP